MQRHSPTVRQRRLARELRRLREAAGLRTLEVTQTLDWSVAKLSRIETGQIRAHWGDVADLLDHYGVAVPEREALIALARDARQRSWWSAYSDVLSNTYVDLETEASAVRMWCPQLVPDLLQTESYARSVLLATHPTAGAEERRRRTEALQLRQENLERSPALQVHAILDEAVLQRMVDSPETHRAQLAYLRTAVALDNVSLRVLPFTTGAHAGIDGAFTILSFANERDPDVVYVSSGETEIFLETSNEVARHRQRLAAITDSTATEQDSTDLLGQYIQHVETREEVTLR